jgi:hypothetical protein
MRSVSCYLSHRLQMSTGSVGFGASSSRKIVSRPYRCVAGGTISPPTAGRDRSGRACMPLLACAPMHPQTIASLLIDALTTVS